MASRHRSPACSAPTDKTMSTANVGLVAATGVASRRIAIHDRGDPGDRSSPARLRCLLTIMPPPVMVVGAIVHRRFHHDQQRADHLDARARLPPHAGDRHGHDDVLRRVDVSGACSRACRIGHSRSELAAGAGDAGGASAQSHVPDRHPPQGGRRRWTRRTSDYRGGREFCPAQRGDLGRAPRRRRPRGIRRAAGRRSDRRCCRPGAPSRSRSATTSSIST